MPTSSETSDYFNRRAAEMRRDGLVDKWEAVAPLFEGLESGRVIECGAGTGLYTLPLLEAGHRVTAVDLSTRSLAELLSAAERAGFGERISIRAGDFLDVAQGLEQADLVTFIKVLHHMPDRQSISRALQLGWSKVRRGGRLVIFEPNGLSPVWPVMYRLRGREKWKAERNLLLIRRRFLTATLEALTGADVTSGYRYLIPGTIAVRLRWLDRLDKRVIATPLGAVAGNVWLSVTKHDE